MYIFVTINTNYFISEDICRHIHFFFLLLFEYSCLHFPTTKTYSFLYYQSQHCILGQFASFSLIVFYWLCYYYCLNFPPLPPFIQYHPLPQAIPTPLFIFMGHACKFFGYSISYTVLYIPWLFRSYLFVLLNPLTSLPILPHTSPIWQSSKHSVSVLLVSLVF